MARKKHSDRSSGRVVKDDAATPNAIRRDEIIEEVVLNLKPWKAHQNRATVATAVRHTLDVLLKIIPLQKRRSDRRALRDHAKKLNKALSNVETLLSSSPGELPRILFYPTLGPPKVHESIEEIERAFQARAEPFFAELKRLRRLCARDFGIHPNYDHAKHLCAHFSRGLMRGHSDGKITGTEDKPFRTIASLLYEVVSGQEDKDLKRACDAALAGPGAKYQYSK